MPLAQGGGSPNSHHSVTMDSPVVLTQITMKHISNIKVELRIQEMVVTVASVIMIMFMLDMEPMVHCSSESKEEGSIKLRLSLGMLSVDNLDKFGGL